MPANPTGNTQTLVTQSSDLYPIFPGQKLVIVSASGSLSPNLVADEGQLTTHGANIVAELFSDSAGTKFVADVILCAYNAGVNFGLGVAGGIGTSITTGLTPTLELENGSSLNGNNIQVPAVTIQSVLFIFQAEIYNNDPAGAHDVNLSLAVILAIEQEEND